jgi:hypothetical protein
VRRYCVVRSIGRRIFSLPSCWHSFCRRPIVWRARLKNDEQAYTAEGALATLFMPNCGFGYIKV